MGRQSTTSSFRFFSLFSAGNANDEWEERMDQMTRQELRTILNVRFDMCRLYIYISIHKSACGGDFLSQQYSCCMQQAVISFIQSPKENMV